jgi:transcriptional regulator with XRE-family HTH domain
MNSFSYTPQTPGQKLRAVRKQHKWSQEQASEQLGVDARTYCRWERGYHTPGLRQLRRLCDVFGVPPEELGFEVKG